MTATLLFDLDGTLVETDWAHLKAFEVVFGELGVPVDEAIFKARIMGEPNKGIGAAFFPGMPEAECEAIFERKEAVYRDIIGAVEPVAGLLPLLDWADAAGVACGVVTNAPRENAELILKGAGIRSRFRTLVCGQELPFGKPHPMAYLNGLRDLGGDAAVSLAFEDSPAGMRSAIAAGLPVIGMTTNLPADKVLAVGAVLPAKDYTDPAVLAFVKARTRKG